MTSDYTKTMKVMTKYKRILEVQIYANNQEETLTIDITVSGTY